MYKLEELMESILKLMIIFMTFRTREDLEEVKFS